MAEFVLKYADGRGQIHQQVAPAASEKELRERYSQQGFLIYSVKPRTASGLAATGLFRQAQEAQPREVPDLQPAVRHADPRGAADSEGAGPAGRTADRPGAGAVYQVGARRSAERDAALGGVPAAGDFSQNVRDLGDGGRKERQPHGGAGPVHHLPENCAGGAEEGDGLADVPLRADRAGDYADGVPGDLRGADVRHALHHHERQAAGDDGVADRHRHDGAQLHSGVRGGPGGRDLPVPVVGAPGVGARDAGPHQDEDAGGRGHLAEIPGGATLAHSGHAADGRHPAGAGHGNGRGFA